MHVELLRLLQVMNPNGSDSPSRQHPPAPSPIDTNVHAMNIVTNSDPCEVFEVAGSTSGASAMHERANRSSDAGSERLDRLSQTYTSDCSHRLCFHSPTTSSLLSFSNSYDTRMQGVVCIILHELPEDFIVVEKSYG
ncbi:unnamed protein product [Phytophthora lilii]|uniref:Unnamed protein product n=1 Tax=Phytophthora lilii TaxID=2077276 RepID=A0A9W6TGU7_9STRA|nr:unnamed protein product [Phytophthora lilii]